MADWRDMFDPLSPHFIYELNRPEPVQYRSVADREDCATKIYKITPKKRRDMKAMG